MTCTLCSHEATYIGWAGDPATHAERIAVCGLHMVAGDEPIE